MLDRDSRTQKMALGKRTIGTTDLGIFALGFGCAPMGTLTSSDTEYQVLCNILRSIGI